MVKQMFAASGLPLGFRLSLFILNQPAGAAITMAQMEEAVRAKPVSISQALVKIRKGRVAYPGLRGQYLQSISIHYARETKAYYDLGKATMENLEQQIPQSILRTRMIDVNTRAGTIKGALSEEGLGRALARGLLRGPKAGKMLEAVPTVQLQEIRRRIEEALAARQQLPHRKELYQGDSTARIDGEEDERDGK